jgi:hypothetical protein
LSARVAAPSAASGQVHSSAAALSDQGHNAAGQLLHMTTSNYTEMRIPGNADRRSELMSITIPK